MHRRRHRVLDQTFLWMVLVSASGAEGRTWIVNPAATGDTPTIQAAIDSSQAGDDILLMPGRYTWTSEGADPPGFITMLELRRDVFLHSDQGAEHTILDAEKRGGVIYGKDVGHVRIEGITVTGGFGAGISVTGDSNPVIKNCIVRDNIAGFQPGGINCENGTITDCLILNNTQDVSESTASGGGIRVIRSRVERCEIRGNVAVFFGDGAGIFADESVIVDCIIASNHAFGFGQGGGVYMRGNSSVINCKILFNASGIRNGRRGVGGGIYVDGAGVITNCIIIGNQAENGAAVFANGLVPTVESCTVLSNRGFGSPTTAALHAVAVHNSILADNAVLACSGGTTASCTDFYQNTGNDSTCVANGQGNFSRNPQFCAVEPTISLNFGLQQDSPCVPGNHPADASCGLIGAAPIGCESVATESQTWSELKNLYRR